MSVAQRVAVCTMVAMALASVAHAQSKSFEGMWSDPPNTPEDQFCSGWCLDAGLERLNALLDDPKNDSTPVRQLITTARNYERDVYLPTRLTASAAKTYPLDPATDPTF